MAPSSTMAAPVILLILLQLVLLQSVQALSVPQRRDRCTMNPNVATWHRSCNEPNPSNPDETKRQAVERAWSGALELIDSAWHRFDRQTYPKVSRVFLSEGTQRDISYRSDPGYALLFALDSSPGGVEQIRRVLKDLYKRANASPGQNGRPPDSPLEIKCKDRISTPDGDACRATSAFTSVTRSGRSIMNFCPEFWDKPSFEKLKSGDLSVVKDLYRNGLALPRDTRYGGTDAKTVVHEWSHLDWMGATNYHEGIEEVYGLVGCANLAWNCGDPIPNDAYVNENADTYGWYAELGYFIEEGLRNLWPQSKPNPVTLPVNNHGQRTGA